MVVKQNARSFMELVHLLIKVLAAVQETKIGGQTN
jgi:hypothetical protein